MDWFGFVLKALQRVTPGVGMACEIRVEHALRPTPKTEHRAEPPATVVVENAEHSWRVSLVAEQLAFVPGKTEH